jgi:hypothetical protein
MELVDQVPLYGLASPDAQDVRRDQLPFCERFAGHHRLAGVDPDPAARRDSVLAPVTVILTIGHGDPAPVGTVLGLDPTGDVAEDRRVAWLAILEKRVDAGQTGADHPRRGQADPERGDPGVRGQITHRRATDHSTRFQPTT